jgi:aspartyl-tRNA(Asn)/glutamyl-tRNA(Gln) amidotransferase subunit B
MEEASLRCDANISLRPRGQKELGVKTELKNMNSFRGVEKALEYEIKRQTIALDAGEKIVQQTYLWDAQKGITLPMRSKEEAHDSRYFPEPDLVPLVIENRRIEEIRKAMPELPAVRLERYISDLGLAPDTAAVLVESRDVGDYFEQTVAEAGDARTSANWVMGDVLRVCKEKRIEPHQLNVSPSRLARILNLVSEGTISGRAARKVFDHVESENKEPDVIVEELGLKQISDTGALEQEVRRVVDENPEEARRLKDGEAKLQGFFVGQIMRATKGKGNPKEINRILRELLGL